MSARKNKAGGSGIDVNGHAVSSPRSLVAQMTCFAAVAILSIAGSPPPTGSSSVTLNPRPQKYIIAFSLAGMAIANATYKSTFRQLDRLAPDLSATFSSGGCTLASAKLGFEIEFLSFYPHRGSASSCTFFVRAVVTGAHWETTNGLRVGSSTAVLRRLFPRAYDTHDALVPRDTVPPGCIDWWLAKVTQLGTYPILTACVQAGRVAVISIEIAGH